MTDRKPAPDTRDLANEMRKTLLGINDLVQPLHEWLDGEYNYLRSQGYSEQEARAMSAATYVSVFGNAIPR